jgi:hypothetical protein
MLTMARWRFLRFSKLFVTLYMAAQLATGQQFYCHYPNIAPWYGAAWEGLHSVRYSAYIPGDHISGPTQCNYFIGGFDYPFTKIYKADGSPVIDYWPIQSARVYNSVSFQNNQLVSVFPDVGQTRNYGAFSPANGSTLSNADEDQVAADCYLWNLSDYADKSNINADVTFPYSTQGQGHTYGTASNPLESPIAKISWDVRTVVDYSNLDYVTAYANVTHTCFPAHVVQVNNKVVYHYMPPRSDVDYVFGCLVLQQGKTQGLVTPTVQVPCN